MTFVREDQTGTTAVMQVACGGVAVARTFAGWPHGHEAIESLRAEYGPPLIQLAVERQLKFLDLSDNVL
jgi:hypothetical protein